MRAAIALSLPALALPHGAVVHPAPRQRVDSSEMPWAGPVPANPPGVESATGWCPVWNMTSGEVTGQNGQSCFW